MPEPDSPKPRRVKLVLPDETIERLKTLLSQLKAGSLQDVLDGTRRNFGADQVSLFLRTSNADSYTFAGESPAQSKLLDAIFEDGSIAVPSPTIPGTALSVGVFGEETSQSRIEVVSGVTGELVRRILNSPGDIYRLSPEQFEDLIGDRLAAMGYRVTRVGKTNQPDGGIDMVFESLPGSKGMPVLGVAQVKHHSKPETKSGVEVVHSMMGVLQRHFGKFNLGMVITNTSFTQEADWFVRPMQLFLRLRHGDDVRRWVEGDLTNELERREFPANLQLTSRLLVDLRREKRL